MLRASGDFRWFLAGTNGCQYSNRGIEVTAVRPDETDVFNTARGEREQLQMLRATILFKTMLFGFIDRRPPCLRCSRLKYGRLRYKMAKIRTYLDLYTNYHVQYSFLQGLNIWHSRQRSPELSQFMVGFGAMGFAEFWM